MLMENFEAKERFPQTSSKKSNSGKNRIHL